MRVYRRLDRIRLADKTVYARQLVLHLFAVVARDRPRLGPLGDVRSVIGGPKPRDLCSPHTGLMERLLLSSDALLVFASLDQLSFNLRHLNCGHFSHRRRVVQVRVLRCDASCRKGIQEAWSIRKVFAQSALPTPQVPAN